MKEQAKAVPMWEISLGRNRGTKQILSKEDAGHTKGRGERWCKKKMVMLLTRGNIYDSQWA